MMTRTATDETILAINQRMADGWDLAEQSAQTGVPYITFYDALNGRPTSVDRENEIRAAYRMPLLEAEPTARVTIDPTREAVRKLPGHGNSSGTLRTWRGSLDDAARLDAKLARIGCSSLQAYVDTVMLAKQQEGRLSAGSSGGGR